MRLVSLRILAVFLLLWGSIPAIHAQESQANSATIAALLQDGSTVSLGGRTVNRAALVEIYAGRDFRPIWTTSLKAELFEALAGAPSQGLAPSAFTVPETDAATQDILLTDDFLRYAAALTRGRVSQHEIDADWVMPQPSADPAGILRRALSRGVSATLATLPPQDEGYERLRQAYERYKGFVATHAWRPLALSLPIRPGDTNDGVAKLRERLAAEGFGAAGDDGPDGNVYSDALIEAVKKFQSARGLPPDGTVGMATLAALNVSPGERLRQIRLNLERRRASPRDLPATRIEVNVPDAGVVYYVDGAPSLTMRAVVGAMDRPTPVMRTRMTSVLLNPPWNIPSSIIVNEIRPAMAKDPNYLKKHDYIYVDVPGGKQLIQKAGPSNALGRVKFEMPNSLDIYLHDTPRQDLMDRARRALSHGCIRVDNPRELARQVLADETTWTSDAIDAAIATGRTQSVPLPHAIPVYLFYWTAWADADGMVQFRADLYGRDQRLSSALVARDLADQVAPAARADATPQSQL